MTQGRSQRAVEVARDLLGALRDDLDSRALTGRTVRFRLDGSKVLLSWPQARSWIEESVDGGFPEVRYVIETEDPEVVVNLAAFEDPDSQFFEPSETQSP